MEAWPTSAVRRVKSFTSAKRWPAGRSTAAWRIGPGRGVEPVEPPRLVLGVGAALGLPAGAELDSARRAGAASCSRARSAHEGQRGAGVLGAGLLAGQAEGRRPARGAATRAAPGRAARSAPAASPAGKQAWSWRRSPCRPVTSPAPAASAARRRQELAERRHPRLLPLPLGVEHRAGQPLPQPGHRHRLLAAEGHRVVAGEVGEEVARAPPRDRRRRPGAPPGPRRAARRARGRSRRAVEPVAHPAAAQQPERREDRLGAGQGRVVGGPPGVAEGPGEARCAPATQSAVMAAGAQVALHARRCGRISRHLRLGGGELGGQRQRDDEGGLLADAAPPTRRGPGG